MAEKSRICFVSMEVYPILKPGVADLAGGAGFQVVQMAKGLRDRGYDVSFVVGDFGQEEYERIDGFDVYRSNKVAHDRSITRGITNLWRLFNAMRKAGAQHYVLRSTRFLAFFVMFYSKLLGAKYTFMVASLPHCLRTELESLSPVFRRLYAISLKFADRVTTQSMEQQELFQENFGILAPVVPNGIEVPYFTGPRLKAPYDINWVSSFKFMKRLDKLLEFTQLLPHRKFLVVGGPGPDLEFYEKMSAKLQDAPNVEFLGFVNPDCIGKVYEDSRVHLCTSDFEGFPNTYLYSWTRGLPTCAFNIDPDKIISEGDLGIIDPDLAALARKIDKLLDDDQRYSAMAHRCYNHVVATNSLDVSVESFIKILP